MNVSLPCSCRFPFVPIDGYAQRWDRCRYQYAWPTVSDAPLYARDRHESYARKKDASIAHDHVKTCSRRSPFVCWVILDVILCVSGTYVVRHVYPLLTRNFGGNSRQGGERRVRVAEIIEIDRIDDRHRLRTIERSFPFFFPSSSFKFPSRRELKPPSCCVYAISFRKIKEIGLYLRQS